MLLLLMNNKCDKMFDVHCINDIVPLILSLIPRSIIISAALVNKYWYQSVIVDHNQETVARNNDMFSLLKIGYSVMVVINIAARYNHVDMVSYLLNKHKYYADGDGISRSFGFSGNKLLINRSNNKLNILSGICEGEHDDLLDDFINHAIRNIFEFDEEIFNVIKFTYKTSNLTLHDKINNFYNITLKYYSYLKAKIAGSCANKCKQIVYDVINSTIESALVYQYLDYICEGLIEGNHYDIFKYLINNVEGHYICCDEEEIHPVIRNNNYEFFEDIILNHYDYTMGFEIQPLLSYCIHYRRVNMVRLILTLPNIDIQVHDYTELLRLASSLKFDDIVDVINNVQK